MIILCSVCADTLYATVHPARVGVLFTHSRLSGSSSPVKRNRSEIEKNFTNCQTAKNAKNSNFSSSKCYGSNLLTRTNATGFPVTLNYRTASRFEDRLDNRARRFLRMLVLFVVVIVDHEELVYILVESFSHVRRAFFCILVLFEQNQVVDVVVVEHPIFCILNSFRFRCDV